MKVSERRVISEEVSHDGLRVVTASTAPGGFIVTVRDQFGWFSESFTLAGNALEFFMQQVEGSEHGK